MVFTQMLTPGEVAQQLALAVKRKRLAFNLSQQSLSERSGVSLAVLKKFEHTGKVSLESLLKLALALGSLAEFMQLFKEAPPETLPTLDDVLKNNTRQRGRG